MLWGRLLGDPALTGNCLIVAPVRGYWYLSSLGSLSIILSGGQAPEGRAAACWRSGRAAPWTYTPLQWCQVVRARPVWRRAAASPLRPWRRFRGNGSVGTPDAKDISRDALTRARLCSLSCLSPARGGCEHEAEWAFKLQSDDEIQFKGQIAKFRFKTPSSRALSPRRSDSSNPCTRGARRTGCPRCTSSPRSPRRGSCCRRRP